MRYPIALTNSSTAPTTPNATALVHRITDDTLLPDHCHPLRACTPLACSQPFTVSRSAFSCRWTLFGVSMTGLYSTVVTSVPLDDRREGRRALRMNTDGGQRIVTGLLPF